MNAKKQITPYLGLCDAYVQFAVKIANENIKKNLRERVLRQHFPRLFRTIWWDISPPRFLWKILFAKLGADGVFKVLIGFCRGFYERSWGIAETYIFLLKSECEPGYFRSWINKTPLEEISDGLIDLENSYRVEFTNACLKSLAMGFGADFKQSEETIRTLVEKEAERIVLPLLGGFALRPDQFKTMSSKRSRMKVEG